MLNGVDGKINNATKIKTLEMLGLGVWSEELDIDTLHKRYADDENINLIHGQEIEVLEIDSHKIHIDTHIAFMLDKVYREMLRKNPSLKNKVLEHIREHKKQLG